MPGALTADDIADRCRGAVIVAAGNRHWNDTRESWLARAAYRLGLPVSRVRALFYRKPVTVRADEWELIKARLAAMDDRDSDRARDRADLERLVRRP